MDTRIAAETLVKWQRTLSSHRNAHQYAISYHDGRLCARVLLLWRLRLRDSNQSAKVAQWADRYFETRRAWRAWVTALENKRRKKRLEQWEVAQAAKVMKSERPFCVYHYLLIGSSAEWRVRVQQLQYYRECEKVIRSEVEKVGISASELGFRLNFSQRVIANTLAHWTNRVIEIKSRELDIAQRSDTSLIRYTHIANYIEKSLILDMFFEIETRSTSGKHVAGNTQRRLACWRTICSSRKRVSSFDFGGKPASLSLSLI